MPSPSNGTRALPRVPFPRIKSSSSGYPLEPHGGDHIFINPAGEGSKPERIGAAVAFYLDR